MRKILSFSLISISLLYSINTLSAELNARHGYIDSPPSRAFLCSTLGGPLNQNCGSIQYEPQSIEGPKDFPELGSPDGKIASGGNERFSELDEQSANRWYHVKIFPGNNNFNWTLTAPHSTESWKFFITKPDWNENLPLTRNEFELTPFCEQFDSGQMPSSSVNINCNVPDRKGYNIILGVWNIADTGNAFYQVIDADINDDGGNENHDQVDEKYIQLAKLSQNKIEHNNNVTYQLDLESKIKPHSTPVFKWTLPTNAKEIIEKAEKITFVLDKSNQVQYDKAKVKVAAGKTSRVLIEDILVPELDHDSNYDYIFPDSIKYYSAGTKVYQPKDKHIYECKPFPYSGFCVQWSPSTNQYEPGVGFAWQQAWTLIK